ncbi:MbtH family protein [Tsukamurella serpentis]
MPNPFDDEAGTFYALRNAEGQYSIWPTFQEVPGGWQIVHGADAPASRLECVEFVDEHWTDMRPVSARE